jgi:LDH2 family malate/lactate/ureidoglycolate dehydrogenase
MTGLLRGTPPADATKPVLVRGDSREAERARRMREGIPIPSALDTPIRDICGRCGAAYVLQDG